MFEGGQHTLDTVQVAAGVVVPLDIKDWGSDGGPGSDGGRGSQTDFCLGFGAWSLDRGPEVGMLPLQAGGNGRKPYQNGNQPAEAHDSHSV